MVESFHITKVTDSYGNHGQEYVHACNGMISIRGVALSVEDWLRIGLQHRLELQECSFEKELS